MGRQLQGEMDNLTEKCILLSYESSEQIMVSLFFIFFFHQNSRRKLGHENVIKEENK